MCKKIIFFVIFLPLLLSSCLRQAAKEGLLIAVSIPPQAWFVSQIAGGMAEVLILVTPGHNPHNYEPAPKQIQALSSARAWILSGVEFEISLLPKITSLFPKLLIVDGTEGAQFRMLSEYEHDDEHEYTFLEIDRHTWLGRQPVKILASHITDTLSLTDKENELYYCGQYEKLISLIDDEYDKLKAVLSPLWGKSVFVYHPSFGYFLDEFGIIQKAVETDGKEPGPRELHRLIVTLKEEQAAAIFVQIQFPVSAAKTLASAAGVELIGLDPLAQDWLDNIRSMGLALQKAVP
jgi:zinc transport system substrate-binding protein